jgi:hypothetical protein
MPLGFIKFIFSDISFIRLLASAGERRSKSNSYRKIKLIKPREIKNSKVLFKVSTEKSLLQIIAVLILKISITITIPA